jgi:hypothetical protein
LHEDRLALLVPLIPLIHHHLDELDELHLVDLTVAVNIRHPHHLINLLVHEIQPRISPKVVMACRNSAAEMQPSQSLSISLKRECVVPEMSFVVMMSFLVTHWRILVCKAGVAPTASLNGMRRSEKAESEVLEKA